MLWPRSRTLSVTTSDEVWRQASWFRRSFHVSSRETGIARTILEMRSVSTACNECGEEDEWWRTRRTCTKILDFAAVSQNKRNNK